MKRFGAIVISVILLLSFGAVWGVANESEELCIPFELTIYALDGVEPQREPVYFSHPQHHAFKCQDCHHQWTGTTENLGCKTSGCHDLAQTPKNADATQKARYYKNAYHTRCIGCHKLIKEENQKLAAVDLLSDKKQISPTGPTGCVECHPRY